MKIVLIFLLIKVSMMKCKVCKSTAISTTGICQNCGSLFNSPVQLVRDSVNNTLINVLLGSFGFVIIGIIIIGALEFVN
jgi:predicted amidophosphoribosyltransferase